MFAVTQFVPQLKIGYLYTYWGPLGTLRGPWGGSGQHVTLGEGGGGGGGGASACSTHFHTSVDLTHP